MTYDKSIVRNLNIKGNRMKNVKYMVAVLLSTFLIGCGSSGSSGSANILPDVDNSELADDENQYGYFGDNVIFENTKIVGGWTLIQESSDAVLTLNFHSDGDGSYQRRGGSVSYGDYGVSKDGKVIQAKYNSSSSSDSELVQGLSYISVVIRYKSLLKDYMKVTHVDGSTETKDCFKVEYEESRINDYISADDIIMCP